MCYSQIMHQNSQKSYSFLFKLSVLVFKILCSNDLCLFLADFLFGAYSLEYSVQHANMCHDTLLHRANMCHGTLLHRAVEIDGIGQCLGVNLR